MADPAVSAFLRRLIFIPQVSDEKKSEAGVKTEPAIIKATALVS